VFEGFSARRIPTSGAQIHAVIGGSGPPLLLLHGYPQTHVLWHKIAPRLASEFTVVAPDLRGYGDSTKPEGGADHAGYSKRAMAQDMVEVMRALGFERFALAGHDRGARVAYRLALDHPPRVDGLAVLDIVPTYEYFARVDRKLAHASYHWFFLAQPADLPERLIGADPEYFLQTTLARWAGSAGAFTPEAMAEYVRCFSDPATVRATCEDYRAGATVDFALDEADRTAGRMIGCPVLALWSGHRGLGNRANVLDVWREWATDVRGGPLPGGHFLPEEAPDETYDALREFFRAEEPAPRGQPSRR
jgi:haloacetate dehalogenase